MYHVTPVGVLWEGVFLGSSARASFHCHPRGHSSLPFQCCTALTTADAMAASACTDCPPLPARTLPADLACLIVSPTLVGVVMQHSAAAAALLLLAWCLLCWLPEVQLLAYAQRQAPALALAREQQGAQHDSLGAGTSKGESELQAGTGELPPSRGCGGNLCRWPSLGPLLRRQAQAWALHARQPAASAALALALLYLTVCSWCTLMVAYLKSMGLPEGQLALFRG